MGEEREDRIVTAIRVSISFRVMDRGSRQCDLLRRKVIFLFSFEQRHIHVGDEENQALLFFPGVVAKA